MKKEEAGKPSTDMQPPAAYLLLLAVVSLSFLSARVISQGSIPPKFDGFWYEDRAPEIDSVMIEAFFDPVCPDSRDAWLPLKRALNHYGPRVSLLLHAFALPYHNNAFVTSRALHIVNNLNTSFTYPVLESIFEHQEEFYNQQTFNMSTWEIVHHLTSLVRKAVGDSYSSAVAAGFTDTKTDHATRISFKYGCTRGVYGTPFFFVNGFVLPDAGSAIDYNGWRNVIDPLVTEHSRKSEESGSLSL